MEGDGLVEGENGGGYGRELIGLGRWRLFRECARLGFWINSAKDLDIVR